MTPENQWIHLIAILQNLHILWVHNPRTALPGAKIFHFGPLSWLSSQRYYNIVFPSISNFSWLISGCFCLGADFFWLSPLFSDFCITFFEWPNFVMLILELSITSPHLTPPLVSISCFSFLRRLYSQFCQIIVQHSS